MLHLKPQNQSDLTKNKDIQQAMVPVESKPEKDDSESNVTKIDKNFILWEERKYAHLWTKDWQVEKWRIDFSQPKSTIVNIIAPKFNILVDLLDWQLRMIELIDWRVYHNDKVDYLKL